MENIPLQAEHHSGEPQKLFAFPPESCSPSTGFPSFNSKLRDESLNGEIFYPMKELRVLAERWRTHYIAGLTPKDAGRKASLPCVSCRKMSASLPDWRS